MRTVAAELVRADEAAGARRRLGDGDGDQLRPGARRHARRGGGDGDEGGGGEVLGRGAGGEAGGGGARGLLLDDGDDPVVVPHRAVPAPLQQHRGHQLRLPHLGPRLGPGQIHRVQSAAWRRLVSVISCNLRSAHLRKEFLRDADRKVELESQA